MFIAAENEALKVDGEAYGCRLYRAGVRVVTTHYNDIPHDFGLLNFGYCPGYSNHASLGSSSIEGEVECNV